MRKIFATIASAFVLLFMSCGNGDSSATSNDDSDSTALCIGVLPTVECLPFYIAEQEGYFNDIPDGVKLHTYESAMDADTAFFFSHDDIIVTDMVKASVWRSRGDSIGVVFQNDLHLFLVTSSTSRLKHTKSVKEKIVAITRNSSLDYLTDKILESVGMISEDLNKPQINNIPLRAAMLNQNQYDGALLPEPYASFCTSFGANRINGSDSLNCSEYILAVVANDSVMKHRKKDIDAMVKAYNKAVDFINQKKIKSRSRLIKYIPQAPSLPDTVFCVPQFRHAQQPTDTLNPQIAQWMRSRNLYGKDFSFVKPR